MRLVVDPGVLVSALITPLGPPARLWQAVRAGRVQLIVSPRLLAELAGVLERDKFRPYVSLEEARQWCQVEVSQRLKRVPTIIDKLTREPTMQLANMQDIGGCRAVLQNIDEVRRVQKRLVKNRPPLRVTDYIVAPRSSGYRGIHVVVCYDERAIEVQLRTPVMHAWAITVERLSGRLQADLKSGRGPEPLLNLLEAISEAMALEEGGEIVDTEHVERMNELRRRAVPWLDPGRGG